MSPITFGPTPLRRARRPPTTSSACVTSHLENCRASTSILFSKLTSVGHAVLENCIASTSIFVLPSYKEPTVDALASTTDEGRVRLRKATGSCLESFDPWMSEWGNPTSVMGCHSGLNT